MNPTQLLKQHGIESVWHFTDKGNLNFIEKYGLLSLRSLQTRRINAVRYGGNEMSHYYDKIRGIDQYVHLAFIKDHPMYYAAKNRGSIVKGVWLEIDIEQILKEDVMFSNKVANSFKAPIFTIDKLAKIDFSAMYSSDFESMKEARKAEIMIPNLIPTSQIKGVSYGK